jgi:hypothetical protein
MLTRLRNWIQGSRRKWAEWWEVDRGHLSEQERHHVDAHKPGSATALGRLDVEDAEFGSKGFDETRRRRPGN